MGYVGIPAAALSPMRRPFYHVEGFQRDSLSSGYKIAALNRGESPLKGEEPGLEDLLQRVVSAGTFTCTPDFSKVAECDAVTLAIQTPFADPKDLIPDFTPLVEGIRNVGHTSLQAPGRPRIDDHPRHHHRHGPREPAGGLRARGRR